MTSPLPKQSSGLFWNSPLAEGFLRLVSLASQATRGSAPWTPQPLKRLAKLFYFGLPRIQVKDKKLLPYAEGIDLKYDPEFDTHKFSFDGTDKSVYVWTPKGYDKNSDEKYPTIYMFDGQTVLATGRDRGMDSDTESWNVSESVTAMMSVTDYKAVIVGISNIEGNRDDELVPDIGNIKKIPTGKDMLETKSTEMRLLIISVIPSCRLSRKTTMFIPMLNIHRLQAENMDYDDEKNAGQIFRIDTSVEPKPGKSNEKTKFKYSSGSWEDFEL